MNELSASEQSIFDSLYGAEPGEATPSAPGIFTGAYKAAAGVPSGLAGVGLDIGQAAVNLTDQITKPAQFVGLFHELGNQKPGETDPVGTALAATQSPFDRANQAIDDTRESANELYRPDPQTTGFIGNTLFGATDVLTRVGVGNLLVPGAGLPLAAGTTGFERTKELEGQGVDRGTAVQSGLLTGGSLLAMGGATSFGSTTLQRILTGGLTNVGFGAGTRAIDSSILEANGYHAQAEQQKWNDGTAILADAVIGSVFGLMPHGGKPLPADTVDAALGAKNAQNAADLAPGVPADPRSSAAHANALDAAVDQLMNGKPVDVDQTLRSAEFVERPVEGQQTVAAGLHEALTEAGVSPADLSPAPGGYPAFRRALESGGQADAANPNSSALGPDQFIASTWLKTVADAAPDWAKGLTKAQLLALRTDPAKSGEMAAVLDQHNATALTQAGVEVTDQTLYAAHHFGAKRAIEFANAADDAPVASILTKAQLKANPYLDGLTKGQLLANWDARARLAGVFPQQELDAPNFGLPEAPRTIADTDAFWQGIPEGKRGRETLNITGPEREALRQAIVDQHFDGITEPTRAEGARPVAYVMGGGGASGKGTVLKALQEVGAIPREGIIHIDPDAIKSVIPEYGAMLERGDSRGAAVVHEESSTLAKAVLAKAEAGKYDLVLDRTLGDKTKGLKELQDLKDAGYDVRLFGVTIDPRLAVSRAVSRAKRSGRFVPLDKLLEAHKGFAGAFEDYAKLADQAVLFDNGVGHGEAPIRIAEKSTGATAEIRDQQRYNSFRGRSQINEQATTLRGLEARRESARRRDAGAADREGAAAARGDGQGDRRAGASGTGAGRPGRMEAGNRGTRQAEPSEGVGNATPPAAPDTRTASAPEGAGRPQQGAAGADAGAEQRAGLDPARAGEVDRAREAAANDPDAVLDDGTTVADALRAADQEVTQAETQAEAIQAAVACALRFGAAA